MTPNFLIGQYSTLLIAPNIREGIKKENLHLIYDGLEFCFPPNSQESAAYVKYVHSVSNKIIVKHQRNHSRLMLSSLQGFDEIDDGIRLTLQKTDYSHTCFVWDYYKRKRIDLTLSYRLIKTQNQLLPNSLCMHLLIETNDGKIVSTLSSPNKMADYPNTIAFTVGEQLELSDITESKTLQCCSADIWLKRTFSEEFGLTEDHYKMMINTDSFRILGLYFEGNIHNFALFCIVRLNISYEEFYREVNPTLDHHEISSLSGIEFDSITRMFSTERNRFVCHPSSAMRLFLYSMHKQGLEATVRRFLSNGVKIKQME